MFLKSWIILAEVCTSIFDHLTFCDATTQNPITFRSNRQFKIEGGDKTY